MRVVWETLDRFAVPIPAFVKKEVEERFIKIGADMTKASEIGYFFDKDTTQGPQASKIQYNKVLGYINDAIDDGAKLVTGGDHFRKGDFIQPTTFTDVTKDVTVFQEEVFGPVLAVTTFKTEDEAVSLTNDTTYGLAAMIFTENLKIAHRTAAKLQTGECGPIRVITLITSFLLVVLSRVDLVGIWVKVLWRSGWNVPEVRSLRRKLDL